MTSHDRLDSLRSTQTSALGGAARAYRAAYGDPSAQEGYDDAPAARPQRRLRWAIEPRTAAGAGIAAVLLAVAVLVLGPTREERVALPERVAAPRVEGTGSTGSTEPPGDADGGDPTDGVDASAPGPSVVVHVVGEVASPGLVELMPGDRVDDAVAAAGGTTSDADLAGLNLARELVDGEQIRVPGPGEVVEPASGDLSTPPASAGGLVNVNTADAGQLETLPGVGPVLAARIVEHRASHGPFTRLDELVEVSGIGDAVLAGLREHAVT